MTTYGTTMTEAALSPKPLREDMMTALYTRARFKKLADVPTPEYKTEGAAGFDLAASEDTMIAPREHKLVPTGIALACPGGHYLALSPRSSLFKNFGLIMVNSPGIVDADYCGDEDELLLSLLNLSDTLAEIRKGDRLAKGVFQRYTRVRFEEVEDMMAVSRGGYGSTGLR